MVDVCCVVEHSEGDVACAAGYVEDVPAALVGCHGWEARAWVEGAHEVIFPEAVNS
jgi:hypothetical protein